MGMDQSVVPILALRGLLNLLKYQSGTPALNNIKITILFRITETSADMIVPQCHINDTVCLPLDYLEQFKDNYVILWAIRGSMYQKAMYPIAEEICTEFIRRHPETVIITTGDKFCQQWEWDHPNVIHKSGRIPFRQALNMAKYADMVVTPETGLGIGAGAFGVPKIMLLTAASLTNIVGNDENDYSLQSPAYCSPCFRAIYNTRNCPLGQPRFLNGKIIDHMPIDEYGKEELTQLPICVDFPAEMVLERMEEAYASGYERNWDRPTEEVS